MQLGEAGRDIRSVERIGQRADEESLVARQVFQFALEQEVELVPQFERRLPEVREGGQFDRRAYRVALREDG
jgi:hypothetical protein